MSKINNRNINIKFIYFGTQKKIRYMKTWVNYFVLHFLSFTAILSGKNVTEVIKKEFLRTFK